MEKQNLKHKKEKTRKEKDQKHKMNVCRNVHDETAMHTAYNKRKKRRKKKKWTSAENTQNTDSVSA